MKDLTRYCEDCFHYAPQDSFDKDRRENVVAIGICEEIDHIVWADTPADDCDDYEEGTF